MQYWLGISLLLCTFGFFREMRPSEPFVTEYLTGEWRNLTSDQINKEVYPFGTYFVLAQLVIIFLITDILRYKPIIILSACAGIILFAILLWTTTIWELQIGQIFYGTFMASEVAYYTYIYAKVDRNHYQAVTGHTRSAILAGKFLAGILAQVLISSEATDYRGLHFISFGTQVISLFIAIALPAVGRSVYFYTDSHPQEVGASNDLTIIETPALSAIPDDENPNDRGGPGLTSITTLEPRDTDTKAKFSLRSAVKLLGHHFVSAYRQRIVVQWSLWWALATCGQLQVISYVQFLWKEIDPNNQSIYNGAVEATVTLLGAIGATSAGMINSTKWHGKWHVVLLTLCTLVMGAFVLISATTSLVWVAYVMYVLFGTCYFFVITIATAIVAANLIDDSFGLIFGINTLIALILQTVMTLVVVTDVGYALDIRSQFIVYGSYFIALAILYCFVVLIYNLHERFRNTSNKAVSS